MTNRTISRPQAGEYAPYTIAYIDRVPQDERVLDHLEANSTTMRDLVASLTVPLDLPHAEGEWTVKEVLVHIMDAERVFGYRALRIARGDTTTLAGYDHDAFVPESGANARPIEDIFAEYGAIRRATVALIKSLQESVLTRQAVCSGAPTSVRALVYQITGHELHHIESIRENYGAQ